MNVLTGVGRQRLLLIMSEWSGCDERNDLDDLRIYFGGAVYGISTFGAAIRLLSLPAG